MIQHVWENAKQSALLNDLFIVCDNEKIQTICEGFGAKVVLNSKEYRSGTDRVAEVTKSLDADIIVNIQADEPLINSEIIDSVIIMLDIHTDDVMITVIKQIPYDTDLKDFNMIKVVIDINDHALYFSRSIIPFPGGKTDYYKHLGIYAHRKDFLTSISNYSQSKLERAEQLEQLRVLQFGYKIKTMITDVNTISVNTPKDIIRVEVILNETKSNPYRK